MRPDFGRCVIERERSGSSNPSPKARMIGRYVHTEDGLEYEGPARIPTSRNRIYGYFKKISDKDFSDVLGPIRGYLFSQVGRKWDDVHSELCQGLGKFSWPMQHILQQHIDVATDTWRGQDGHVYYNHPRLGGTPSKVDGGYLSQFYVHPETGTLRHHQKKKFRWQKPEPPDKYDAGNGKWLVKVGACWFLGTYEKYSLTETSPAVVWPDYKETAYGRNTYRFTKLKSASKKEIKKVLAKCIQTGKNRV